MLWRLRGLPSRDGTTVHADELPSGHLGSYSGRVNVHGKITLALFLYLEDWYATVRNAWLAIFLL